MLKPITATRKTSVYYHDLQLLHPIAIGPFNALYADMALDQKLAVFQPFETYRTPHRQRELYGHKPPVSKAKPWHSAHQYGVAVDFVPFINNQWDWDGPADLYNSLHELAAKHGIHSPIKWDLGHLVLRNWKKLLTDWLPASLSSS